MKQSSNRWAYLNNGVADTSGWNGLPARDGGQLARRPPLLPLFNQLWETAGQVARQDGLVARSTQTVATPALVAWLPTC